MKVYFDYPDDATQARTELISAGVPERDITLDIHQDATPLDGLKRFAGDPSAERSHGVTMIVEETDWLRDEKVESVIRRHQGKIRD